MSSALDVRVSGEYKTRYFLIEIALYLLTIEYYNIILLYRTRLKYRLTLRFFYDTRKESGGAGRRARLTVTCTPSLG